MKQDYTVVVLGAGAVGKTSMISQFLHGFFPNDYQPTIEDCHRHLIKLPDGMFKSIEILDSAGSHQFPAMRNLAITRGQAFILVFSIENEKSFLEAMTMGEQIVESKGTETPLVLVGNKLDLQDERQVSYERAMRFAKDKLCCTYIETSAKLEYNVSDLFRECILRSLNIPEVSMLERKNSEKCLLLNKIVKRNNSLGECPRLDMKFRNEKCTIL